MDQELQDEQTNSFEVNAVEKFKKNEERNVNVKSIPCQICSRKGHGALNCYNRINFTRFPPMHNRKLIPIGIGSSSPSTNAASMWYPDSGSTTYITANGKILNFTEKYMSSERVVAANGETIGISDSGKCTMMCKGREFRLKDILVVPEISKNLLLIHQLCTDSPVSVEFDKHRERIRDPVTKEMVVEGKQEDGLYQLPMKTTNQVQALSSERISGEQAINGEINQ